MTTPIERDLDRQFERWKLFLQRWQNEVVAREEEGQAAQRIASEFGKSALNYAVVLNAGALVALPPFMQWLNYNGRSLVANMAIWFPVGIVCAAAAYLIVYFNYMGIKKQQYAFARKRGRELDLEYVGKDTAGDKQHAEAIHSIRSTGNWITGTQYASIVLVLLSYFFFILGVFQFITLAQFNTMPPAQTHAEAPKNN